MPCHASIPPCHATMHVTMPHSEMRNGVQSEAAQLGKAQIALGHSWVRPKTLCGTITLAFLHIWAWLCTHISLWDLTKELLKQSTTRSVSTCPHATCSLAHLPHLTPPGHL